TCASRAVATGSRAAATAACPGISAAGRRALAAADRYRERMTDGLTPRSSRLSHTEMTELVLPQHSNVLGTAFGGTVLAWMDVCGAICAQRHSGRVCVTAAIDDVNFVSPIRVGDVVIL